MTGFEERYKVDVEAEQEGVWVELPDVDIDLKIARLPNKRYNEERRKAMAPYTDGLRHKKGLTTEQASEMNARLLAKTVLLGWRVRSTGEEVLPLGEEQLVWSEEMAFKLLTEPALHDFRSEVEMLAIDQQRYRAEGMEIAEGN